MEYDLAGFLRSVNLGIDRLMLVAVDQTFEFFENENLLGFLDLVFLINI